MSKKSKKKPQPTTPSPKKTNKKNPQTIPNQTKNPALETGDNPQVFTVAHNTLRGQVWRRVHDVTGATPEIVKAEQVPSRIDRTMLCGPGSRVQSRAVAARHRPPAPWGGLHTSVTAT